jgi:hypothetical protein
MSRRNGGRPEVTGRYRLKQPPRPSTSTGRSGYPSAQLAPPRGPRAHQPPPQPVDLLPPPPFQSDIGEHPAPTAPLWTGSPGEPLLPEMPQSSSPRCRVALAVVPNPSHRRSAPESGRPLPPLLWVPTVPYLRVGRSSAGFAEGHEPSPVPWVAPDVVPTGRIGTMQAGRALKAAHWR